MDARSMSNEEKQSIYRNIWRSWKTTNLSVTEIARRRGVHKHTVHNIIERGRARKPLIGQIVRPPKRKRRRSKPPKGMKLSVPGTLEITGTAYYPRACPKCCGTVTWDEGELLCLNCGRRTYGLTPLKEVREEALR